MNFWIVFAFSIYIQGIIIDGNIIDLSRVTFVEKGKNINISCNIGKRVGNLQWYKENKDGGLDAVSRSGCYSTDKDSRYQIYCENRSVLAMEIRDVLISDSGVYYCSVSGLDQTFHLTSTLIVTDGYPRKPTLSVLASVEDHPRDSEPIVLLCVAINWTKEWDLIKWTVNGTEEEGWTTLDPEGILRSLFVMSRSHNHTEITCYIKESATGDKISHVTRIPVLENDDERSASDCYMVLYVGLPIIIAILLIHQIILACRRRTLSKEAPRPDTPRERRVRFTPQDETVTYAAVK